MEPKEIRKRLLNIDEQLLDLHSLISEFLCDVELPESRHRTMDETERAVAEEAPKILRTED